MRMIDETDDYEEISGRIFPVDDEIIESNINDFEDFDDSISDIDFSQLEGDFKSSFHKVNRHIQKKKFNEKRKKKPLTKKFGVGSDTDRFHPDKAVINGPSKKKISKVLVPRDRKVIVEGVSKFILSKDVDADSVKNIGYYKGKKLKKLLLTFNNDSALDFNLQIFNPSMPLDYLYSTSLNLNDKVQVASGYVQYTDVLFNLLANPAMIINAAFVFAGPLLEQQKNQSLQFINQNIDGDVKIHPINMGLNIDNMQVQNDIVYFDFKKLNRPFIPDGQDFINYTVLPGMTCTFCFYYTQRSLKKLLFKEARESKELI